jgi:hypothetical protein
MRTTRRSTYQHAGIELSRVPGEEKLRVRRTSAEGPTAENQDDEEEKTPGEELVEDLEEAEPTDEEEREATH